MSENAEVPFVSDEAVKLAASESVQQDQDIRSKVRDLTLNALKTRQLNTDEVRGLIKAVTEGVSVGLDKRSGEIKSALTEAMTGLDEALMKSAEATHLALRQLTSQGKDFTDHELKDALENLKKMEGEFVSTMSSVADAASAKVKQEMQDLVMHIRRTGTDSGAKVADALNEFGGRVKGTMSGGAAVGMEVAREVSNRLALVASGILSGLSDALHEKTEKK